MSNPSENDIQNAGRAFSPGTLIANRFELCEQIGQGGMGVVYRALDRELDGQEIAVKLILPHLSQDESVFRRFRNEVLVARSLTHPNVVRIHDFGRIEAGYCFLSMEYVPGRSLREALLEHEDEGFDLARALEILRQVSAGIAYAHSRGVIHRDLKTANILVGEKGEVKLADFGTARALDSDNSLTKTGQVIGTPDYMAPEQIKGEELDAQCDIYSLGIVAYELVTGCRPFTADSAVAVAFKHLNEPMPRMRERRRELPVWFEELVLRATAKTKKARIKDVGEFTAELERHMPKRKTVTKRSEDSSQSFVLDLPTDRALEKNFEEDRWDLGDWQPTQQPPGVQKSARFNPVPVIFFLALLVGGGYWYLQGESKTPALAGAVLPLEAEPAKEESVVSTAAARESDRTSNPSSSPPSVVLPPLLPVKEQIVKEEVKAAPVAVAKIAPPVEPFKSAAELRLIGPQGASLDKGYFDRDHLHDLRWSVRLRFRGDGAEQLTKEEIQPDLGIRVKDLRGGRVMGEFKHYEILPATQRGTFDVNGTLAELSSWNVGRGSYNIEVYFRGEQLTTTDLVLYELNPVEVNPISKALTAPPAAVLPAETPPVSPPEQPQTTNLNQGEVAAARINTPREEQQEAVQEQGAVEEAAPPPPPPQFGFEGHMRTFGGTDSAAESRAISLKLSFENNVIKGSADIEGLGNFQVEGKSFARGLVLELSNADYYMRLTSGPRGATIRGIFEFPRMQQRGSWEVHGS